MKKKRNRTSKIDYTSLTALEVYSLLINNEIPKFPPGFVSKEAMKEIIREVILNKEKFKREDICANVSYDYLGKYKLRGSRRAFDNDIFQLITYCFPEFDIKHWELKKVRNGFWASEKNRKEYMEWLIQKENINPTKLSDLKKISAELIDKNLGRKAREYSNGVYNLILIISKIQIKEWQVINISKWDDKKAIEAVKWLVEERLMCSDKDVFDKITIKAFEENDLGGLLQNYFKHNVIKALNLAYPGKFKRNASYKIELA